MKMKIISAAVLAAILTSVTAHASLNLVIDGSFENPAIANHSWTIPSSIAGAWTSTHGIEIQRNAAGTAYDGYNLVELDTTLNSAMSQTITTTIGQLYDLSFAYSARPGQPDTTTAITASFTDGLNVTLKASGIGKSDTVWTVYHYLVHGTGHDTLTFTAGGASDSMGGYLDDVRMTAVPEPSTLIAGGLLAMPFGLSIVRRLRKNCI